MGGPTYSYLVDPQLMQQVVLESLLAKNASESFTDEQLVVLKLRSVSRIGAQV